MPEFNPLAGFSPSCWAVFVQIEHCAFATPEMENEKNSMNTSTSNFRFIMHCLPQNYKVKSSSINKKAIRNSGIAKPQPRKWLWFFRY